MKRQISGIMIVSIFVILGGCIFMQGGEKSLQGLAANTLFPGLTYVHANTKTYNIAKWVIGCLLPLYQYTQDHTMLDTTIVEDSITYDMLLAQQEKDEDVIKEDVKEVSVGETQTVVFPEELSREKLRDLNYLISKFYTVDQTTTINENQMNADVLLDRNMKLDKNTKGPKILIYHTHSQEAFADSKPGDVNDTIVGMGALLSAHLTELGIENIHHTGVYDLINGKLDRSKAYQQAETGVKTILNQYPSIEVVIDLHRDGVPDTTRLITEIDGKRVAKIMFFNGLCRTRSNGDLTSMPNPYIQDNLAFSLQMQLACDRTFSGLTRRIYLKGYRYNMHLMPKSLLIEAGAQTNTVEEIKNAMNLLAKTLSEVLL